MPKLKVKFTRGKDKKDVLSVFREDGSTSWQHQQPGIPVHDLTHFAVESCLGLQNGFYGLLAQGWDISRLTDRDVRSVLPPEGLWTELVVGLIQSERLSPEPLTSGEFNAMLKKERDERALKIDRNLNEEDLGRIRASFLDLYGRWRNLKPGDSLNLELGRE